VNCKPGDLAVVVRPRLEENRGALVRCISLDAEGDWLVEPLQRIRRGATDDGEVFGLYGDSVYCADSQLRPIRDSDGTDETLTWASKPEPVAA
jgi:hypothetical protein